MKHEPPSAKTTGSHSHGVKPREATGSEAKLLGHELRGQTSGSGLAKMHSPSPTLLTSPNNSSGITHKSVIKETPYLYSTRVSALIL